MDYLEQLIKPEKLKIGDKVVAISLSWGGAGAYPYRYEIGKSRLESIFGLQVYPTKHALRSEEWISNNPKARADVWRQHKLPTSVTQNYRFFG